VSERRLSIARTVQDMLDGDELALAKLISLAEKDGPGLPAVRQLISSRTGRAHRIGITGPPGAGKSTLVDRLISHIRQSSGTAAVLAFDPSSTFTGGAVLGDRVRMQRHSTDRGVYIRSLATRGALGGLSGAANAVIDIVDASGRDYILVETVGVGQSELDVFDYVDTVVVVLAPDSGDSVQSMKAGLLEIADIFVVNKSDLSGAEQVANNLRAMLEVGGSRAGWEIPVLLCQAENDIGVNDLVEKIIAHRRFLAASGHLEKKRGDQRVRQFEHLLEVKVLSGIRSALNADGGLREVLEKVKRGELDPDEAAGIVLKSGLRLQKK